MADWPAKKNAAFDVIFPIYDADGDLVSAAATLDSEVSKDKGTFTDCTNEATEIATSSGIYYLTLTATEMNADVVATITKTGTAGAKTAVNVMYTATRQLVDLAYPATSGRSIQVETDGMVHADVKEWLGSAPNALQSGRVDSYVGAMAAAVITAAAVATGAIDADALAADGVQEIADQVWDEDIEAAHGTDATAGWLLRILGQGISNRVNNANLNDLLGVADVAARDLAGQVWQETTRTLSALGFTLQSSDFTAGFLTASLIATDAITNTQIAADAIGASELAQAAADQVWASAARTLTALGFNIANTDFSAGAIDANAIATTAAQEIADELLKRDVDQVEATAAVHSLTTAILKAVARIRDNAGTLEIYRTNGVTIHASQTITTDAGLDPIDELTGAA